MRENSSLVGSGIVAKACHSLRGEWVIRIAVPVSGRAITPSFQYRRDRVSIGDDIL